ncbi:MAG TPA: hypothetical protein VI122_04695 [Thermoleophilaceae bacterium]|jgi:hypothetical protein
MRGAALLLLLLAGLVFLVPAGSLAQSAGDEQYVDPFQESPQGGGGGSGGGGGGASGGGGAGGGSGGAETGGDTGSGTSGAVGGSTGSTASGSSDAGGGFGATATGSSATGSDVLPRTGLPVGLAAVLGAVLLVGGVALRRGR